MMSYVLSTLSIAGLTSSTQVAAISFSLHLSLIVRGDHHGRFYQDPAHAVVLVQRELDKCLTLLSNCRQHDADGCGLWLRHRPVSVFRHEEGSEYLLNPH